MWCPHCKSITSCKGVSPKEVSMWTQSGRRFYKTKHQDIHYFKRGRICLDCQQGFLSAETQESFLTELVELRDALKDVKANVQKYSAEAASASAALSALTKSLDGLKALDIYQKSPVPRIRTRARLRE
jgi:hypothetical protein